MDICPEADSPHWQPVGKSFYREQEGAPCKTAQSALTVIFRLVIGGLTSITLTVLGTLNLQFPFMDHSLVMGKGLASLNEAMSRAMQGDQTSQS